MSKNSKFFDQPIYGQLIKSLDCEKIVEISRKYDGEKYVKSFDGYTHLLTMLYVEIQRFDSLREIEKSMTAEVRKLHHIGINTVPPSIALFRTQMQDVQRSSLRMFIVIYIPLTRSSFHRTADAMVSKSGF